MSRQARRTQPRTRAHYESFGPPAIAWSRPLDDNRARFGEEIERAHKRAAAKLRPTGAPPLKSSTKAASTPRPTPPGSAPTELAAQTQEVPPPDVRRQPTA